MNATTTETHPLAIRFDAATKALADAETALADAADDACEGPEHACSLAAAYDAAEAELDEAREELKGSDAPRTWSLSEDESGVYDTITASSPEEALEEARDNVDHANYSECEGTLWIDVRVRCVETGEEARATVTLEPEEPECSHTDGHDWDSPYELVGGLRENPGVHGHGGGIISTEVCMHCGCARVTDTWAQRRDTGEQGLTSVSYEEGKYSEELYTSVELTADGMGDATEDDYDSYVALVESRISEICGFDVSVSARRYGDGGAPKISADLSDRKSAVEGALEQIWDEWCSSPATAAVAP